MQPIGPRRDAPTTARWRPVDELLAEIEERQETDRHRRPLSDGQLARALTTPPPRNPLPDTHAPRAPKGMGRRRRKGTA